MNSNLLHVVINRGLIARSGEYGNDLDETLNYPDEVRDSWLFKIHALVKQYVSQEKFTMTNYLPKATTSSLRHASFVDEFAT